jgi:hypothetical protein
MAENKRRRLAGETENVKNTALASNLADTQAKIERPLRYRAMPV